MNIINFLFCPILLTSDINYLIMCISIDILKRSGSNTEEEKNIKNITLVMVICVVIISCGPSS